MPTSTIIASTRILRLAFGTALALWFSQTIGWSLSYVAPVFTLLLLATPKPSPGLKGGLVIASLVTVAVFGGLLLLPLLFHHTLAGILVLTVVLFHAFYFTSRGGNAVLGMLIVVGLTMTVAVGSVSVDAVVAVAQAVSINAYIGVLFVLVAHAVIPDLAVGEQAAPRPPAAAPTPAAARREAFRSLAIVLPVAIAFLYSSDSAGYVAVMIKVTSMTQQVNKTATYEAAKSLLLSTVVGGFAALAGWTILGVWPLLAIYVLLVGLGGLWIGPRIFAGEGLCRDAATWSYAYLTMIVILAPAVTDSLMGSNASIAFLDRLMMFAGATVYGVLAVTVFDAFASGREPCPSGP